MHKYMYILIHIANNSYCLLFLSLLDILYLIHDVCIDECKLNLKGVSSRLDFLKIVYNKYSFVSLLRLWHAVAPPIFASLLRP